MVGTTRVVAGLVSAGNNAAGDGHAPVRKRHHLAGFCICRVSLQYDGLGGKDFEQLSVSRMREGKRDGGEPADEVMYRPGGFP